MRKRFFIFAVMVMICSVIIGQTTYSQKLVNKAEAGDAEAQNNLGACYANGDGVSQDYVKAVYWYTKAAEQGNAIAQNNLGICYYDGNGVSQDYAKAAHWFTKAAEQGNADAQFNLGMCFYYGGGVNQDQAKAVYWYTKASEQGNAYAQFYLGMCFYYGNGVNENKNKAIYLCEKAATVMDDCEHQAQYALATIYYSSPEIDSNYEKAVKYLTVAKESCDGVISCVSCDLLSKCYRFGRGVPKDVNKADELQAEAEAKGCGGDIDELMKKLKEEYSIVK